MPQQTAVAAGDVVHMPVAFGTTIASTPLSPAYRLGLIVVAAAMLLLPLVYVALIGLVASAVVWHLTRDTWMTAGSTHLQGILVAYVAPAVAGSTLVFFMIKPILAR